MTDLLASIDWHSWLSLILRWTHVIVGIAWIGASFYFVWLDNHLVKPKDDDADGELWSVHGGGFYHNRKYMAAPAHMPSHLHWFKYEAYFTWITGFLLLATIYYFGAHLYLIDKAKMALAPWQAIGISLAMLAGGWLVYDLMCKSPLRRKPVLFGVILFVLLTACAWGAGEIFADHAAYIQIGAMIGTMMAGNVFFNIIPNQKIVVADLKAGHAVNPEFGKAAKLRSMHNNYMTLPVVFIMISGHYPMTYGSGVGWLSLALIALAGISVRHWFNVRETDRPKLSALILAPVFLLGAILIPPALKPRPAKPLHNVSFAQARQIINTHCIVCHSATPTHEGFDAPPLGLRLDSDAALRAAKAKILARAVIAKDMPLGNETGMTEEERDELRAWIAGE